MKSTNCEAPSLLLQTFFPSLLSETSLGNQCSFIIEKNQVSKKWTIIMF